MATAATFNPTSPTPLILERYIAIAEDFIGRCDDLAIPGSQKLKKKLVSELKFLSSLADRPLQKRTHLSSSNLGHFAAMLHLLETLPSAVSVFKPFSFPGDRRESLPVDVVACQGHLWLKVIARKAQALHLVWAGQGQFGERSLLDQASDYLQLASLHQVNFKNPKLCYSFYNGVTEPMAAALEHRGIIVSGEVVAVSLDVRNKLQSVFAWSDTSDIGVSDSNNSDSDAASFSREAVLKCTICDIEAEWNTDFQIVHKTPSTQSSKPVLCTSNEMSHGTATCSNVKMSDRHATCDDRVKRINSDKAENTGSCTVKNTRIDAKCTDSGNKIEYVDNDFQFERAGNKTRFERPSNAIKNNIRQSDIESCNDEEFSQTVNMFHGAKIENVNENYVANTFASPSHSFGHAKSTKIDIDYVYDKNSCSSSTPEHAEKPVKFEDASANTDKPEPLICKNYYFFEEDSMSSHIRGLFAVQPVTDNTDMYQTVTDLQSPGSFNSSPPELSKVNLDVTALIALISNITHGGCHFVFEEKVLTAQAAEERRFPVLPKMTQFIQGKDLFTCQTAVRAFSDILNTLGGARENSRAEDLMSRVTVVPDQPSSRTQWLPSSAKIKDRSKVIFGTGDALEMITLTANSGFIRAAENQGVSFTVFIHAARALTEEKERTATAMEEETGQTIQLTSPIA